MDKVLKKGGGFWCGEWCLSEGRMFKVWKAEGEEKLEGGGLFVSCGGISQRYWENALGEKLA
ncbi:MULTISPECIES: hypothetical protein [unclassified Bartonella]|uniref:hypothetical protein n=1 Tax=unclassified Bartonella TaxID=2645622 RepID=UPI0035CE9485